MNKSLRSLYDILLVAQFELQRNLRNWRALALGLLYILVTGGGAYLFSRMILQAENAVAASLGVPETETPGAMIDKILENEAVLNGIGNMVGDESLVEAVLQWPLMAVFFLWLGMLIVPFLAAVTSAESLVIDTANRAARFECVRTGRFEFVVGRFLGQLFLLMACILGSAFGVWFVAMVYMVEQPPVALALELIILAPRLWFVALPYLAIGVVASMVTSTANMARLIAVISTIGTLIIHGVSKYRLEKTGEVYWDALLQVTPHHYFDGLWILDQSFFISLLALTVGGIVILGAGMPLFFRRDL